jgi:Protein of unknown function (DUF2889)
MSDAEKSQEKERLLCSRKKNVDVYLLPGNRQYRVQGEMQDGVHHMRLNMTVNEPSLKITEISCDFESVPDTVCLKARNCLASMIGKRIVPGLMRSLNGLAHEGCTHMINLFHEACYNITLAQAIYGKEALNTSFPGLTEEQLYKIFLWFKPELENSCVRYSENTPFMKEVKTAQVPEGAEALKDLAKALRK